eukprot:SAG31_NODE_1459_length_8254_cov_4.297854_8_plen_519_part_00
MRRTAEELNANGQVPIFSLEAPFDPHVAQERGFPGSSSIGRVMTEADIADALSHTLWYRYYEWFGASGWSESIGMSVLNVRNETARNIPVIAHAYPNSDFKIGVQVAAFLIAQANYSYFMTSASCPQHGGGPVNQDPWTDAGFCWHTLYDLRCGIPLSPAALVSSNDAVVWRRHFENCTVTLDQTRNLYSIVGGSGEVMFDTADESSIDRRCSLNGVFQLANSSCLCDPPWSGPDCGQLVTLPAKPGGMYDYQPVGYWPNETAKTSSWGGNVLPRDSSPLTDWDLWVAEIPEGLANWEDQSRCVHATAPSMDGPFVKLGDAMEAECHNPQVIRDPISGDYLLFHIGHPKRDEENSIGAHSWLARSHAPGGPYVPLNTSLIGGCNNPAPAFHPTNNTLFVVCNQFQITSIAPGALNSGSWTPLRPIDGKKPEDGRSWEDVSSVLGNLLRAHTSSGAFDANCFTDCFDHMISFRRICGLMRNQIGTSSTTAIVWIRTQHTTNAFRVRRWHVPWRPLWSPN